jgi:hypothetical protein
MDKEERKTCILDINVLNLLFFLSLRTTCRVSMRTNKSDDDKTLRENTKLWGIIPLYLNQNTRHTINVCTILILIATLLSIIFIILHETYIAHKKICHQAEYKSQRLKTIDG